MTNQRSPEQPFHANGRPLSFRLGHFWQWAASDLMSNALRGVLAEFLVSQAVGAIGTSRIEWDACDLRLPSGARLEVKASGYLQSWSQRVISTPSFDIAPKRGWDAASNTYSPSLSRSSEAYVFALHAHTDRATADPLDVEQWAFYVVPTGRLDSQCATQKRIGLTSLSRLASPVRFSELAATVSTLFKTTESAV